MSHRPSCTNGAVASAHPAASDAGLEVLKQGGNAVDAIVTTSLTLSAVLPPFSGIGGGGFLMLHLASEGKTTFLDYREVAPNQSRDDMFPSNSDANRIGHLAVAVPGTLKGLSYALEKFGTIGMDVAIKPGIELAARGTTVTKTLKRATDSNLSKLRRFSRSNKIFLHEGDSPEIGTVVKFPELSKTYAKIAREGVDEFYKGETAQHILGEIESEGGILKSSDLVSYDVVEREPISFEFGDYEFFLPPPPSAGGIQIAQALLALEETAPNASRLGQNSFEYLFVLSKILGATFSDREQNIADPDFFNVDVKRLLSPEHVSSIAPKIDLSKLDTGRSTTHMCAADKEGNVAALTESIECFYGSGVVGGESGVLLNDTMHDFSTDISSPNSIASGKTPLSSMSPTIVCKNSKPFLTCGSAGGPRIISAALQTILNVILFGMGIQEAINVPRFHYQGTKFLVESRVQPEVRGALNQSGYDIELYPEYDLALGGVQGIKFDDKGAMTAGADPRREASAVCF